MKLLPLLASIRGQIVRKGAWHWVRFVCILILGSLIGHELESNRSLTSLRYWLYPYELKLQQASPVEPVRTAVVTIDDRDYWGSEFAARSPLKRDVLARILDRLREAQVNTVVLDVDLRSPDQTQPGIDFADYANEDKALLDAMRAMCAAGHTLIASTSVRFADGMFSQVPSLYTAAQQGDPGGLSCVHPGYIQLPYDLRQVPGPLTLGDTAQTQVDSLSMAAVKVLDPQAYEHAAADTGHGFRFARYLSQQDYGVCGSNQFRFCWHDLEATDIAMLRHLLANKVVLIGGAWHASGVASQPGGSIVGQGPAVDSYNSPMGVMPGVFLHANYIEAIAGERGTFASMSDSAVEAIEIFLAVALAVIGILEVHVAWKWGAFFLSCVISVVLTYFLLEDLGIFLDFLIPILILIGHTLVEEFLAMRHELHHLERHTAEVHR